METIREHKVLSSYCGILILLIIILLISIFSSESIGMMAYFQNIIMSLFFMLLGLPFFLFFTYLLIISTKELIQDFPTYFYKRKKGMTKKGKKEFKSMMWLCIPMLIGVLMMGGFSYLGISTGINAIRDIEYLDNPQEVILVDYHVHRQSGRHSVIGRSYRIQGYDRDNNYYDFRIGKYAGAVLKDVEGVYLYIEYLPYSDIVMEVK